MTRIDNPIPRQLTQAQFSVLIEALDSLVSDRQEMIDDKAEALGSGPKGYASRKFFAELTAAEEMLDQLNGLRAALVGIEPVC